MPWFLAIFFTIYAAMHAYLFWKVRCAFGRLGAWRYAIIALLLFLTFSPVLVLWLESHRDLWLARPVGVVGYLWMPMIFWFCILAALADAWNLVIRRLGRSKPRAMRALVPPRAGLCIIGMAVVAMLCWGLHEAADIQLRELTVQTSRLAPGSKPIRIAVVSDMHLGINTGKQRLSFWGVHGAKQRLARTIELINQVNPDMLLSLGDLVDSPLEEIPKFARPFAELHPPLGKLAILGNHEYFVGADPSVAFHEACGFQLLRGQAVMVGGIRFVGVDDPAGRRSRQACFFDEQPLLPARDAASPMTILLKHQPIVLPASIGRFDLQLSGHTHGGQIFPFHLVVACMVPYFAGQYDLGDGSQLYVSRGTGAWGPPVRFLAPPEVTVVTIVPASK